MKTASKGSVISCLAALLFFSSLVRADDGYRLWLRYEPLPPSALANLRQQFTALAIEGNSPTLNAIRSELTTAASGLLRQTLDSADDVNQNGTVIAGTPKTSKLVKRLVSPQQLRALGDEGYLIRSVRVGPYRATLIAANTEAGALYGSFHFLRLVQTLHPIANLNVIERPRLRLRVLDHWDNLDGSIERGYAGRSLWTWDALPNNVDPRLRDYARANASIGINGSTLNNVNANSKIFTPEYLEKVAAIADVFRPYGIHVYLSVRFSAPIDIGGLKTADPLDAAVAEWWKKKTDEIYALIPDFGGFVVKANSEGQPGPRTYNRTHADGANMLAAAIAPHHGVVMWRAFVYDMAPGYDRAGAAYENLQPFDGKFARNVLLQVKNGPIDFQPREPFHPLFGAMPKTQLLPEFQITQEYLGFSNHLVFLAPMWREFFTADTYAKGRGSTVARVVDGTVDGHTLTGIAGVANTGSVRNWTGHDFAQANWYAYGELAWNPNKQSRDIAREWIAMTFSTDPKVVDLLSRIMVESHEALVDYMTPLGLHHIMWGGHHYGPAPWENKFDRADWNPVYYHKADKDGVGFDRSRTGSNAVAQYRAAVSREFGNLDSCPEKFLLWFHHVRWDHRMRSGRTLWDEMALHYQRGVDWVRATRKEWNALSGQIDPERHEAVAKKLALQERDAIWWRDAVLLYFQQYSQRALPIGVEKPAFDLDHYKATSLNW